MESNAYNFRMWDFAPLPLKKVKLEWHTVLRGLGPQAGPRHFPPYLILFPVTPYKCKL